MNRGTRALWTLRENGRESQRCQDLHAQTHWQEFGERALSKGFQTRERGQNV